MPSRKQSKSDLLLLKQEEDAEKKKQETKERIELKFDQGDYLCFVKKNYDGALAKYEEIIKE
jgi:hypothetical protein